VRRLLLQVLELGVGDEVEAGGLEAIEGEEASGVDLVPHYKHADDVAEAELTLARILSLQLFQTAACWKANPRISFQAVLRATIYCSSFVLSRDKACKTFQSGL
jgi:hypothetical protein